MSTASQGGKTVGFQKILATSAYRTELESTAVAIIRRCHGDDSEQTIASVFENELYHFVRIQFGITLKFIKEAGKGYFRHSFRGRVDATSSSLLIEYKRQSKLRTQGDKDKAVDQLEGYLSQLERPEAACGIVTDGEKLCFITKDDSRFQSTRFIPVGVDSLDKVVRLLIGSEEKSFTASNVIADFTLSNMKNPSWELSQALFRAIAKSPTEKTLMLYEEWLQLFHLSDADTGKNKDIAARKNVLGDYFNANLDENDLDYKALFALQTTYAIVVKLIACKVIGKLVYNDEIQYFCDLTSADSQRLRSFLEQVEDGYVYSMGGIRNLLEGDFFSWYSTEEQWSPSIGKPIGRIVAQIEMYSTVVKSRFSASDIFKDLYMDFIPPEVRHSLGEYYTPDWLADHIVGQGLEMLGPRDDWVGIDPCCGSGVFVLNMVKRIIGDADIPAMSDNEKARLLHRVLSGVRGIDINPLSVLTARVNLYLAISDLITPGQSVELPIYVGDSAILPSCINVNGVDCYRYTVNTSKREIDAILPKSFVQSSDFSEKMNSIQTYVKAESPEGLYSLLAEYTGKDGAVEGVREHLMNLADALVELHVNHWDGIWVRMLHNFMLVARIDTADLIVGNPPWVKWEYLPERYADKLKQACLAGDMFSGQRYMGAISLNVCAAIAIMTATAWLSRDGVLAFLMPTNLMTQDSYEGFRKFKMRRGQEETRLFLQKVEDWRKAGKLFGKSVTEPCSSYYYSRKHVDYFGGFPVKSMHKIKGESHEGITCWDVARSCFVESDGTAFQMSTERSGYTVIPNKDENLIEKFRIILGESSYRGRTGVEFVPNEVTMLEFVDESPWCGKWLFRPIERRAALHKTGVYEPVLLEAEFIQPLLTAPEIGDFKISSLGHFCVFPYRIPSSTCAGLREIRDIAPMTAQYLLDRSRLFTQQSERSKRMTRGDEFYALSKVGKYTFAKNMVVLRDNTRMCACVVKPQPLPWGGLSMPIPAKHAIIISTHSDRNETPISEDEAFYLAGVFNTPVVRKWFEYTYSSRSYSLNFKFKIPLYDPNDGRFSKITRLSRRAHEIFENNSKIDELEGEIEALYLSLCSN